MDHWFQVWIYWACGGHVWHCYSISAVQCTIHWPGRKTNGISDWRQMTLEQLSPIDWVCKAIYVITAMHQASKPTESVLQCSPSIRTRASAPYSKRKDPGEIKFAIFVGHHWICTLVSINNEPSIDWSTMVVVVEWWPCPDSYQCLTILDHFGNLAATSCVHAQCTRNEAIWPRFDCIKSCLIIIIVIIVVVQLSWVALRFFSFSQLFELLRAHDPISLVRAFARVRSFVGTPSRTGKPPSQTHTNWKVWFVPKWTKIIIKSSDVVSTSN